VVLEGTPAFDQFYEAVSAFLAPNSGSWSRPPSRTPTRPTELACET